MSLESDKYEDREFDFLVEQKRHNELKQSLQAIANILESKSAENFQVSVLANIKEQTGKISDMVNSLRSIKIEVPQQKQEANTEILKAIDYLCKEVVASNNKVIEALESRELPDSFTLVKNYQGMTTSVNVNYKKAKNNNG